jgi:ribosomal protein L32
MKRVNFKNMTETNASVCPKANFMICVAILALAVGFLTLSCEKRDSEDSDGGGGNYPDVKAELDLLTNNRRVVENRLQEARGKKEARERAHEAETTATARFCSNCGAELAPGNRFCSSCGTKTNDY